jgi:predicted alpha/beta hydrolase family esterase
MRLLEKNKLLGCFLVCACHTDLGCASEAEAGYYNRPWDWDAIKSNVGQFGIMQCHSCNDPLIPMHEAEHVAINLMSDFKKCRNRSHFFDESDIDDLLEEFINKAVAIKFGGDLGESM